MAGGRPTKLYLAVPYQPVVTFVTTHLIVSSLPPLAGGQPAKLLKMTSCKVAYLNQKGRATQASNLRQPLDLAQKRWFIPYIAPGLSGIFIFRAAKVKFCPGLSITS